MFRLAQYLYAPPFQNCIELSRRIRLHIRYCHTSACLVMRSYQGEALQFLSLSLSFIVSGKCITRSLGHKQCFIKKKINSIKIVSRVFFFQAVQTPHLFFKIELKQHDQYTHKGLVKTRIIWFFGVVAI